MKRVNELGEWKRVIQESGAVKFDYDGAKSILIGRSEDGATLGWFDEKNNVGVIKERADAARANQKAHFGLHEQLKDKADLMWELEREVKFLQGEEHFLPKSVGDIKSGKVKLRDLERIAVTMKKIVDLVKKLKM